MRDILMYIESQSPFVQGLIASAVFGGLLWLSRQALSVLKRTGQITWRFIAMDMLYKHWVYKNYVSSSQPLLTILGHVFVVSQALMWVIRSALVFVFFFGVDAIVSGNWLWVIAAWISFNYLFESHRWLQNWSKDEEISIIAEDIKKEFFASVSPPKAADALDHKPSDSPPE